MASREQRMKLMDSFDWRMRLEDSEGVLVWARFVLSRRWDSKNFIENFLWIGFSVIIKSIEKDR